MCLKCHDLEKEQQKRLKCYALPLPLPQTEEETLPLSPVKKLMAEKV